MAAGATDYRVYMFLGVMARDAGDRERAIGYLRKAHEMDPAAPNPALELGFTLEEKHADEAAEVYGEILKRDPQNRPALLGMGRIDRGKNRLEKARAIYERLLAVNPNDPDALNGLAWLAACRPQSRCGNARASSMCSRWTRTMPRPRSAWPRAKDVYRYSFDAIGNVVTTASGTSWGFGGTALLGFTAFDTLELAETHFGNEIQTLTAIGRRHAAVGRHPCRLAPARAPHLRHFAGLRLSWPQEPADRALDRRQRDRLSHRLPALDRRLPSDVRRLPVGRSPDPHGTQRLAVALVGVSAMAYNAAQAIFNNYQYIWSWVVDVTYYGPHNTLVVAGVGYSPTINNVDLHARTILPVTDRIALQLIAGYNSLNFDTRVTRRYSLHLVDPMPTAKNAKHDKTPPEHRRDGGRAAAEHPAGRQRRNLLPEGAARPARACRSQA